MAMITKQLRLFVILSPFALCSELNYSKEWSNNPCRLEESAKSREHIQAVQEQLTK